STPSPRTRRDGVPIRRRAPCSRPSTSPATNSNAPTPTASATAPQPPPPRGRRAGCERDPGDGLPPRPLRGPRGRPRLRLGGCRPRRAGRPAHLLPRGLCAVRAGGAAERAGSEKPPAFVGPAGPLREAPRPSVVAGREGGQALER